MKQIYRNYTKYIDISLPPTEPSRELRKTRDIYYMHYEIELVTMTVIPINLFERYKITLKSRERNETDISSTNCSHIELFQMIYCLLRYIHNCNVNKTVKLMFIYMLYVLVKIGQRTCYQTISLCFPFNEQMVYNRVNICPKGNFKKSYHQFSVAVWHGHHIMTSYRMQGENLIKPTRHGMPWRGI